MNEEKLRVCIPKKRIEAFEACKADYLRGGCSLREAARRHGLPQSTVFKRSKREGWNRMRDEVYRQAAPRMLALAADDVTARAERLYKAADRLTGEIDARMSAEDLLRTARDARDLAGALRELKDVLQIRTEEDKEEQKARIEKLKSGDAAADRTLRVVFGEEEEECSA